MALSSTLLKTLAGYFVRLRPPRIADRSTVSEPCWPRTVALKCEYAIYTDSVDTEEKRGRIWLSTAISDVLAPI